MRERKRERESVYVCGKEREIVQARWNERDQERPIERYRETDRKSERKCTRERERACEQ